MNSKLELVQAIEATITPTIIHELYRLLESALDAAVSDGYRGFVYGWLEFRDGQIVCNAGRENPLSSLGGTLCYEITDDTAADWAEAKLSR